MLSLPENVVKALDDSTKPTGNDMATAKIFTIQLKVQLSPTPSIWKIHAVQLLQISSQSHLADDDVGLNIIKMLG